MAFSLSTRTLSSSSSSKSISRLFALRFQSSLPSSPDPADDSPLRQLEDAIHRIVVRRAAPDWLPFLPGSSYWVPPPRSHGVSRLIEKLAERLSDEQTLSTSTVRGWPSSDYFLQGARLNPLNTRASASKSKPKASSNKPEAIASSDDEEAVTTSSNVSKTEDDEG